MPQTKRRGKPKKNHSLELLKDVSDRMAGSLGIDEEIPGHAISGLMSQYMGVDPDTGEVGETAWHNIKAAWDGHPERKRYPGLVTDTLSLPNMFDNGPEWSKKAQRLADDTHTGVRDSMDLGDPEGFANVSADAAGTIFGQLPMPAKGGKVSARALKDFLMAIPEYLSPTTEARLGNYVTGGLGVGALDSLLNSDTPSTVMHGMMYPGELPEDPRIQRHAGGGRIKRTSQLIKKLEDLSKEAGIRPEMVSGSSPNYLEILAKQKWGDKLTPEDAKNFAAIGDFPTQKLGNFQKHSLLLPDDIELYRGLGIDPEEFKESVPFAQSATLDKNLAEVIAGDPEGTLLKILRGKNNLVVPNPWGDRDEFIIPENRQLKKTRQNGREIDVQRMKKAKGGKVHNLSEMLRSLVINPDARANRETKQHLIGDPLEEVLYAAREGLQSGKISSLEHQKVIEALSQQENEENLQQTLEALHAKLFPTDPAMRNYTPPPVLQDLSGVKAPVGHGTLSDEEWNAMIERRLNPR